MTVPVVEAVFTLSIPVRVAADGAGAEQAAVDEETDGRDERLPAASYA